MKINVKRLNKKLVRRVADTQLSWNLKNGFFKSRNLFNIIFDSEFLLMSGKNFVRIISNHSWKLVYDSVTINGKLLQAHEIVWWLSLMCCSSNSMQIQQFWSKYVALGKRSLVFYCTSPTNAHFWQIKIK